MITRDAYILGSSRIPFVKSMTNYQDVKLQELMAAALQGLTHSLKLEGQLIGDVALGAIISSAVNWNLAREAVLSTTLNPHTPAYNVQRACGTGLETIRQIALKISHYQIETGIGGGCDSNSDLPIGISKLFSQKLMALNAAKNFSDKLKVLASFRPSDLKFVYPAVIEPRTGLSMGQHCEKMVKEWGISRHEQDELALKSHQNAAIAYQNGFYTDLVCNFMQLNQDSLVRNDTSLEKLSRLKPAFDRSDKGTLTAGNSTPLTDGAAAVFLASEDYAKEHNYPLLARFVDAEAAAVDFVHGEGLLMAPTMAVSSLLRRNNLSLQDFDFYEIHEAFAGQVLCTLKAWESKDCCKNKLGLDNPLGSIDLTKMNTKGGSVALGHPFAATGARIVGSLAKMLYTQGHGRGLISICTAGGMGVAAILEAV